MMDLPTNYNKLSQEQRRQVRATYALDQDYKCYYCKDPLMDDPAPHVKARKIRWARFPPNFLKHPIHLHHSHDTGMTIGAVHALCNAVLWQYHGE